MSDNRDHLRALFDAYVKTSGIPLTLSYPRLATLREFDRRKLTPEDVVSVVQGIKAHIDRGTQGYTESSIDWRNAMGDVDTFEERALKARQSKERRKGSKPRPVVAVTTAVSPGESVTRLDQAPPSDLVPPIDMKKALRDLANNIGKGTAQ